VLSADWTAWHEQYDDPLSPLTARLGVVQGFIREFLDSRSGRHAQVVSLCAGKGLDLLGVLSSQPEQGQVTARLVELDPGLADEAREAARVAGLTNIEVLVADAGRTDAYVGAVPADLVLACGVFGNVSNGDVEATVCAMPAFCVHGGTVIWTRHRLEPDLTPAIRRWFSEAGFAEQAFTSPGVGSFAVGVHRLEGPARALAVSRQLFTFVR
jgi:hypothetical protein